MGVVSEVTFPLVSGRQIIAKFGGRQGGVAEVFADLTTDDAAAHNRDASAARAAANRVQEP